MTITDALLELVSWYPGFEDVRFGSEAGCPGLIPQEGEATESVRRSVTGRVRRVGLYPFAVAVGAGGLSPDRRAGVKEALEGLGTYLERLEALPDIDGGKLIDLARVKAAYMDGVAGDMTERWVLQLAARYETYY